MLQVIIAVILTCIITAILTAAITISYRKKVAEAKVGSAEEKAREIIDEAVKNAETKKRESSLEIKEESIRAKNELDKEIKERRAEIQRNERRIEQKEANIDRKLEAVEKREAGFAAKEEEINREKEEVARLHEERVQELERISGLTSEQAKEYLLKTIEDDVKIDTAKLIKEMESKAKEEAGKKAKEYVEESSRYTVMALRTWSTNKAQLHLMEKMDFHCETRLKNDRGEGIDTLYFVKEITGKGIRAYGYTIGNGKCGIRNTITDVPGVKVGHYTVRKGKNQTGVTVIIPCDGFVYERKPLAAVYALNGFGKTQGTVQIEELGVLETPIALTNTLNVGKAADGLVTFTEKECRKNGKELVSVNPVVGETNDSRINQITERVIEAEDVLFAIEHAEKNFKQGAVGAGRGTVCFGLKGGIGSASRILTFGGKEYTIGVLVQSNFGKTQDLTVAGVPVGRQICTKIQNSAKEDKGSIMVIVGTDLPLGERQLKRVLKRAAVGLIRTGSFMGHGSGDVFIGFTNANGIPDTKEEQFHMMKYFPENQLDKVFRLVAEAVEESILNSLTCAKAMPGRDGEIYHSLSEFL